VKVLATYAVKGGVGKTSAAVNLAWLAAAEGFRTLLWDLDPQGAATYLLRVKAKVKGGGDALVQGRSEIFGVLRSSDIERLDVVPADLTYRTMDLALDEVKKSSRRIDVVLREVAGAYDVVILDAPPSVSLVSENVLNAAELVLSPVTPSTLSVRTLDQLHELVDTVARRRPQILGFLSMVDRRRSLHRQLSEQLPHQRLDVTSVTVPASALVERMGERRRPVVAFAPTAAPAQAYRDLWQETAIRLGVR